MSDPRDAQMIASPDEWPQWPLLPLKRRGDDDFPEVGCLLEGQLVVYLCNMWSFDTDAPTSRAIRYPSIEALLDDGWVVD
jgi:hypothetical protein